MTNPEMSRSVESQVVDVFDKSTGEYVKYEVVINEYGQRVVTPIDAAAEPEQSNSPDSSPHERRSYRKIGRRVGATALFGLTVIAGLKGASQFSEFMPGEAELSVSDQIEKVIDDPSILLPTEVYDNFEVVIGLESDLSQLSDSHEERS